MRLVIASYILQKEHNLTIHELSSNKETQAKYVTNYMSQKRWRSIRHNLCFNEWKCLEELVDHKCTDKFDHALQDLIRNSNKLINNPKTPRE